MDVDAMQAHGDISIASNATLNSDTPPNPYSNYVKDPYADLDVPAASACDVDPQLIVDAAPPTGV